MADDKVIQEATMKQTTISRARWLTRALVLTALVVTTAALLAGQAGATVENERSNSGWYTGLEHADLPRLQPAVQNEYSNSGWYTGLEYEDLPRVQAASTDGGFPWAETSGVGAAFAAVLIATTTLVATRRRNGRLAAE